MKKQRAEAISFANGGGRQTQKDPVLWNDWHVLARSSDLLPGTVLKVRLLDQDLVLWRGQDTQILAWDDRCPHRSVRLSRGTVVENTLICSYHGLVYDQTGRCIKVPAHPEYVPPPQACVLTYQVREQYGLVFVCLGQPEQTIVPFPEWEDPNYRTFLCGPYPCRTNGLRAIENFLDAAHFPFTHTGILGDPEKPTLENYEVTTDEQGVRLHNVRVWQPDPAGIGQADYVTYDYQVLRPLTAYLRKHMLDGQILTILDLVTPVKEDECISWMLFAVNYEIADEDARAFQETIILQDVANLESHHPQQLPLDMLTEFHIPCDRGSLAYRQWLKKLGLTYGVLF
ncbi:MAG: aromatic ring-hydroxylating dioxygenase subunit alpha [Scytolyngbya sp. HA4215-MV1]|jgi:phenylpropionate dioxygenase-like ring-hydroxylating dioxygenase large terminal subunit|nr:aromatic ring-hydroxylating dioxygenase subunit alpha [Scytolyngbya sp. HA4215-MV1]